MPPDTIPTYYGQPAVKSSYYGWKVALYTILGGIAGAAQAIVSMAQLLRPHRARALRSDGRVLSLAGTAAGAALLVADLHTPQRWYHMLRIFRPTSAMSLGTYILSGFGLATLSGLWLDHSRLRRDGVAGRLLSMPGVLGGAGMGSYTAAVLAATSTPLWAAAPHELGAEFAAGAMADGAACLSALALRRGDYRSARGLDAVACVSLAAELAASRAAARARRRQGVDGPLRRGPWAAVHAAGTAAGVALPIVCYGLNALRGYSPRRSALAAAGIVGGSLLKRWSLFEAGNQSARQPDEYFRMTGGRPWRP